MCCKSGSNEKELANRGKTYRYSLCIENKHGCNPIGNYHDDNWNGYKYNYSYCIYHHNNFSEGVSISYFLLIVFSKYGVTVLELDFNWD